MGKQAPRFSVVIPAWNAGRYIRATLDSVRRQGHPSVEVIVCDGGSTDDTLAILDAYRGLDLTWRSGPDRGQLDALQKAIGLARGEILYWLNADDILMPGSLAEVDAAFAADPSLDMVYSDDFGFDEERRMLVNGGRIRGLGFADHALFYRQMYSECVFWRRTRTRLLPESDYDLRIRTDYAFFLNMRPGLRMRWLPKRLGAFRMAEGQMSQRFEHRATEEFVRIRQRAWADAGWSPSSVPLRRALHAPSFWLRHKLAPAIHALCRAAGRKLDGGRKRQAMTDAFYNEWLGRGDDPPAADALVKLLYR